MDAVTRIAGIATIDDYSQRWANWPWPSSSKDNDFICSQDLARASGIVTDSLGPNSGVLVEWFTLGSLLPEGDWQGFPRESSCKWEWKWPDRIQRFSHAVNCDLERVFPRVKDQQYRIGAGYGKNQCEAWKCFDAGLAYLEHSLNAVPETDLAEIAQLQKIKALFDEKGPVSVKACRFCGCSRDFTCSTRRPTNPASQ